MWVAATESLAEAASGTVTIAYVPDSKTEFWVKLKWTAVDEGDTEDNGFRIKIQEETSPDVWTTKYTEGTVSESSCLEDDSGSVSDYEWVFDVPDGKITGLGSHNVRALVQRVGTSHEEPSDKHCSVHVVEAEPYVDPSQTIRFEDWPADGSEPRSPKYAFGQNDPIYVELEGLGTNPYVAETSYQAVWVLSESDSTTGVKLHLKETGINTQIFRNSLPVGELLYLWDSTSEGYGDKIKVLDEEVLTFKIKFPLVDNTAPYTYVDSCDVKVDRAEVGVEWQVAYDVYDVYPRLDCADDFSVGFYNEIGTGSQVWFKNFNKGDLESSKWQWESSGDDVWADSVDFAVWCGHGTAESETPRCLRFFIDRDPYNGSKRDPEKLTWSEIDWGDQDMEWVALNTCRFLKGSDSQLKAMASGVHLICGYESDMTIYCAAGQYFADKLDEMSIKAAWHKQCWKYQPPGNTSRVFGATNCMDDSLGASGSMEVSRDPTASSSYTHDDYTTEE
jgi:hypothetical protein